MHLPRLTLAMVAPLWPLLACADPGYYVFTPYDRAGLTTVDVRYWTVKRPQRTEFVWPELALSYGVNTRWTTGVLASWIGKGRESLHISSLNWQNVVLLTQGEWPVDVALYGAWIRSRDGAFDHALEWGPMLQTDLGRTHLNLNLLFERTSGAAPAAPTQLKYQWQIKQRLAPGWQAGVQGFGEVGDWRRLAPDAAQSHRAGPVLFAQVPGAGERLFEFQAAILAGRTGTKSGRMVSLRSACTF